MFHQEAADASVAQLSPRPRYPYPGKYNIHDVPKTYQMSPLPKRTYAQEVFHGFTGPGGRELLPAAIQQSGGSQLQCGRRGATLVVQGTCLASSGR